MHVENAFQFIVCATKGQTSNFYPIVVCPQCNNTAFDENYPKIMGIYSIYTFYYYILQYKVFLQLSIEAGNLHCNLKTHEPDYYE